MGTTNRSIKSHPADVPEKSGSSASDASLHELPPKIQDTPQAADEAPAGERSGDARRLQSVPLSPIPILECDRDGKIVYSNSAYANLLSRCPNEDLLPADFPQLVKECLDQEKLIEGKEARFGNKILLWSLHPLPTDGRVCLYGVDITEKEQLEAQLCRSQKMEAIGQLAAGVCHEINNLLMIISGYSELLARHLAPEPPLRKHTEEIRKATEQASILTRQLVNLSRKHVSTPEVLDLNSLVKGVDNILRCLLGKQVELLTTLCAQPVPIRAEAGPLQQVLLNLALNARDAMPQGGQFMLETSVVELEEENARRHEVHAPGSYAVLSVSDTGIGIPQEIQSHIFEPFFSGKEQEKGAGLGLYTAHGIIRQHGGNILVYSEPDHGCTFKILFPLALESEAAQQSSAQPPELTPEMGTILLVDDEVPVRDVTREFLMSAGYTVLEASTGEEAIRICETHEGPIQLLLTDVVMSGMSGPQLGQTLASRYPSLRVLYTTGYTNEAIIRHGLLGHGTPFIQKPFSINDLTDKVRQVLEEIKKVA